MNQLKIVLSFALLSFLLIGCSSNNSSTQSNKDDRKVSESKSERESATENLLNKLANYETVALEEKNEDHEVTIEYPKFSYAPLDDILATQMKASFKIQTSDDNEALFEYDMEGIQYIFRIPLINLLSLKTLFLFTLKIINIGVAHMEWLVLIRLILT